MTLRANLATAIADAARLRGSGGKAWRKSLGITLDIPQFVDSYERDTDTLKCVSHYYPEERSLQGVFFYQNGKYVGHQTRRYQSTKNLLTLTDYQNKLNEHHPSKRNKRA